MKTSIKKFTLSKAERLHKKLEIDFLFSNGKKINSFPLTIFHTKSPSKEPTKVIFLASKRIFPRAYQRNKAKRILKEVYRHSKIEMPKNTFIGISLTNKSFTYNQIIQSFQKALRILNQDA